MFHGFSVFFGEVSGQVFQEVSVVFQSEDIAGMTVGQFPSAQHLLLVLRLDFGILVFVRFQYPSCLNLLGCRGVGRGARSPKLLRAPQYTVPDRRNPGSEKPWNPKRPGPAGRTAEPEALALCTRPGGGQSRPGPNGSWIRRGPQPGEGGGPGKQKNYGSNIIF